jgi:hypothetical protein
VRTWKEAFISCFKAVFWHLLWEAEEKEIMARTSVRIACNVAKILTVNLLYTGVGATAISACSVMNQIISSYCYCCCCSCLPDHPEHQSSLMVSLSSIRPTMHVDTYTLKAQCTITGLAPGSCLIFVSFCHWKVVSSFMHLMFS